LRLILTEVKFVSPEFCIFSRNLYGKRKIFQQLIDRQKFKVMGMTPLAKRLFIPLSKVLRHCLQCLNVKRSRELAAHGRVYEVGLRQKPPDSLLYVK